MTASYRTTGVGQAHNKGFSVTSPTDNSKSWTLGKSLRMADKNNLGLITI